MANNIIETDLVSDGSDFEESTIHTSKFPKTDLDTLMIDILDQPHVNLVHCGLKKLPDISHLTQTTVLCLRRNRIHSIANLPPIPLLTELDLYDNLLTKIESLESVPLLTYLDLSFNNIRIIEHLEALIHLQDLYLIQNKITIISCLSNLKNLTVLELGANR